MKMLVAFLIILLGLFLFLTRDYNSHEEIDKSVVYPKIEYPTSKVQLDIKLNTQELAKELSVNLPMEYRLTPEDIEKFNSDESKKYKWISANISRLATPKVEIREKLLYLEAKAKVSGRLNYKKCTKIPFYDELYCIDTDTDFSMVATISTKIDIDVSSRWSLVVKNIEDLSISVQEASASVYGVDIPITLIVNSLIQQHSKEFIPTITKSIEQISIKRHIERVWNEMHLQKRIPNEDMWFHFIPKDIAFAKTFDTNNTLTLHPRITGEARIVTDSEHNSSQDRLSLPNLKPTKPEDSNFSIKIPVELNYDEFSKILMKKVANKNIETKGFKIFIENIKLYSLNQKIYIEVNFHTHFKFNLLNTEGTITFIGTPDYNVETHELKIDGLEYSLNTKKSLASVGSLLWHDYFKKEMQNLLRQNIYQADDILKSYKDIINKKVTNLKIHKDIELNGDIDRLGVDNIYLSESKMVVVLIITGELDVAYQPTILDITKK